MQHLRTKNKNVYSGIRNSIKKITDRDNDIIEPGPSRNPGTKDRYHLCSD